MKKKRAGKRVPKWVMVLIAVLVALLIFLTFFCGRDLFGWFKGEGQDTDVTIPTGAGAVKVSSILKENDLIDQPLFFRAYAKITNQENNTHPGTYRLHKGMGYQELLDILQGSENAVNRFVVPEGYTLDDIAAKLEESHICSKEDFLTSINDPSIYSEFEFTKHLSPERLSKTFYPMEGYAFPATYKFKPGSDSAEVARAMLKSADQNMQPYYQEVEQAGLTLDEAVTLASIIQKEAGTSEDMPKISSVLHNRLSHPETYPCLECTPTEKYAQVVAAHLQAQGKSDDGISVGYDTFQTKGIPVGPICNPGLEALNAALHPEQTEYYFFCPDLKTKETFYAKTYEEHKENLARLGIQP